MIIRGEVKLIVPYKFPLIMGNEFCGVVDKVGKAVRNFAVGDRVYGRMPLKKIGAFAEYAAVDQNAIAKVPEYLSDEDAASVPLTALTALQAFELMNVKSGKTVFISGGTGSLGAMTLHGTLDLNGNRPFNDISDSCAFRIKTGLSFQKKTIARAIVFFNEIRSLRNE